MMSPSEILAFIATCYPPARDPQTGGTLFDPRTGEPVPTRKIVVPYSYTLTFTLTAAETETQQLPITANADFLHLRTSQRTNVAGGAQTCNTMPAPLARILITDSGTNEQFMAQPVDLVSYCTVDFGNEPGDHPFPRIISGRSALTVQLSSFEAVNENVIDVTFIGCLIRVFGNP